MAKAELHISGKAGTEKVLLRPKGMTLGQGSNCDIVLDDKDVSRLHARIFQDPFGRWIIEDLGGGGVFIDGERIKAHAVSPGQEIRISGFSMSISEESDQQVTPGTTIRSAISIVDEGTAEDIVSYKTDDPPVLSPDLMQHLNGFTAELLKLSSPSELYSEACLHLARMLNTLVAVVRVPCRPAPLPDVPDVLACHFGGGGTPSTVLTETNLYLSRSVLDAIRSSDTPVMASSWPSQGKKMMLTVVDRKRPHLVYSARVNDLGDTVDALYLDILETKSVKEMYYFVEASARQINFVQKNLFYIELKKQEEALREANIQLREKDRIKDEYVSRVTHDIKGHLAAIQSSLYVAASESAGPLNEMQSDFLGRASTRNEQLTAFVRELLNLTQMRLSGRLEAKPFSLRECLAAALETVAPKAGDKSITLTSKIDPAIGSITGDEFSFNEMIMNLLFNAIKYTPDGKTVHLEAGVRDGHNRIDISDTGIGIPADEVASVFDEFFRATNARKSEKDGTGLGLSIVRQIVERHGGEISVESREGQGSTFTVTLPKGA